MDSDNEQVKMKKKKYSKKGQSVPSDSLGFRANIHADIIDPKNIKRTQLRGRKKYTPKSTKDNFMARLKAVIDVTDLPPDVESHMFKVTKKSEWAFVKKVIYRTREKVHCSICLEEEMVASQITYCGHIFCFHCILMHFKKSANCYACPVCKEVTDKDEVKTCQPKFDNQPVTNEQIVLKLKLRQGQYIYQAETLHEDIHSMHVIRMRPKGIIPVFEKQLQEIKFALKDTVQTDRNYIYLMEALTLVTERLNKGTEKTQQHVHINLRENQMLKQNIVYRFVTAEQQKNMNPFYQQKSGNLVFLHKLSKKYMSVNKEKPIFIIKSTVLQKEQIDFSGEQNDYKELSIFNVGCQVDAVIIDLVELVKPQENIGYRNEVNQFIKRRERYEKQQEAQLEKLRLEYEAEQNYLRELKEQQQSQYYFDVKLPPTLEPSDFNEHSFPSLITTKSEHVGKTEESKQNKEEAENLIKIGKVKSEVVKQKKFDLHKEIESFPDLAQAHTTKIQEPKASKGGKKKKKKQKFVDMTHQILFRREEEEDY